MLELKSKWFTNSLAKESILKKDFIVCENGVRLFIVGYGNLTSSGKNTYNYEIKDEQGTILASGENAYLDKLTTIIKGENPKTKERKEKSNNPNNNENMKVKKSTLANEFIKLRENLKKATLAFNEFQTLHNVTTLDDVTKLDNEINKRNEEIEALKKTLEIAKATNNEELMKAIEVMIQTKENK